MKNDIVEVRTSGIDKKGVFAVRDIKSGEVVLKWHPKVLGKSEFFVLPVNEKDYVVKISDEVFYLMQEPERYVNHSCEPNTEVTNDADVAIRDIMAGEEITSDYGDNDLNGFECNCGSAKCRGQIGGKSV